MKPIVLTFPTANIQAVCKTQNVAGAGSLILNGKYVSNYIPTAGNLIAGSNSAFSWTNKVSAQFPGFSSVVSIASINDLSADHFTISGFLDGFPVSETRIGPVGLGGPNPVLVYTTQLFSIVTSVTVDAAVNGVSIGTGNSGKTNWLGLDYYIDVFDLAIATNVATATYSFTTTLDDVQVTPYASLNLFTPVSTLTGATTDILANYVTATRYCCMVVSALTGGPVAGVPVGSLITTFMQQGLM